MKEYGRKGKSIRGKKEEMECEQRKKRKEKVEKEKRIEYELIPFGNFS
jgi:hypothetical protein